MVEFHLFHCFILIIAFSTNDHFMSCSLSAYDDGFITTSTDPPGDNNITSSSNPEIIGAVIGAFLLLVITAGVILTILNRYKHMHARMRAGTFADTQTLSKHRYTPSGHLVTNDVVSASMRRHSVASTLIRRHIYVLCPPGRGHDFKSP